MGRDSRINRGSRSGDSGSSIMPILLIVGLVIGIPAILVVGVLVVIFGLTFFAAKKGVEAVDRVVQEENRRMNDRIAQQKEIDAEAWRKQQDALKNKTKLPVDPWPPKQKDKEPKIVPVLPPPPKIPGTNQIDLIALIDVTRDKVNGDGWVKENGALHCKQAIFVPRIEVPYIPPAEYDFIVTFSQPGLRNGISLIMPKPDGNSFFWYLGSNGGASYGFAAEPMNKEGQVPGLIKVNAQHTTVVQVRRNSVKAFLDGKELMNLPTDFREFTCDNWREIRDTRLLAVACDDPTVFHFVRLIEVTGTGQRTR